MRPNDGLQRVLVWLLITAVAVYLLERLFELFALLATPLVIFGMAWLIALALRPIVDRLTRVAIPSPIASRQIARARLTALVWYMPRSLAVTVVYVALLAVMIIAGVALVPILGPQIADIQRLLPSANTIAGMAAWTEGELSGFGLRVDLERVISPETIAQQAATLGSTLVQQSLGIAGSVVIITINTVLVLILSFYMTLDGPRLANRVLAVLPMSWRNDTLTFFRIVDRTFGGFLRAQVLQGGLYGLATAVLMLGFNLSYVALASLMAAMVVLIPILGGVLAVIPPLLVAAVQAPGTFLPLLVGLLIVQQVLFNMIMPRLMGQIVGLHPLLVFAAILVGGAVAGAWGILFGIPVAGVIASVAHFFYLRAIGAVPPPSSEEGANPAPAGVRYPESPPTGSVVEDHDKEPGARSQGSGDKVKG